MSDDESETDAISKALKILEEDSTKSYKKVFETVDSETVEPETAEPETVGFKIENLDDLRRVLVIAQGGNPDAQQSINDFLKFDNNIERTNLPTRRDVVLMAYLEGCSKLFYPALIDNPFNIMANVLSIAFMAKGGEKSKQFVELMKQTPNLADLQTMGTGESQKPGLMSRIFGGRKE